MDALIETGLQPPASLAVEIREEKKRGASKKTSTAQR
jgi:hypothetical protein